MPVKIQLIVQLEVGETEDFTEKAAELLDELDYTVERLGHDCVNAVCNPA